MSTNNNTQNDDGLPDELYQTLYDAFPSKYMKNKLNATKIHVIPTSSIRRRRDEPSDDSDELEDSDYETIDSSNDDDDYETIDSQDDEPEPEPEKKKKSSPQSAYNIFHLDLGEPSYNDDDDDEENTPEACEKRTIQNKYASQLIAVEKARLHNLISLSKKTPNNKKLKNDVKKLQAKIEEQENQLRDDIIYNNKLEFKKLFSATKKDKLFFENLDIEKQQNILESLTTINNEHVKNNPLYIEIINKNIPNHLKYIAMQKLNMLSNLDTSSTEYAKIQHWIDSFMNIPFGIYANIQLPNYHIDSTDPFIKNAENILNETVYGLNDAKFQILRLLGQLIVNPNSTGTAIAIKGPPGTGKTSLIKDGISKILNRPFAFIALGGTNDGSYLSGHSYTYEGSTYGKIVQILMQTKCMNPIIYFDELDKISDSTRGDEITNILTHLTDTSQNSLFSDKYFSDIHLDLSKCLFIFSYNVEEKVNPILKDRMYCIETTEYSPKDKLVIAKNYILPKIYNEYNFKPDDVIIPDDVIKEIINKFSSTTQNSNYYYEQGVRNLKRTLETLFSFINLGRLVKPNTEICAFAFNNNQAITLPFTVSQQHVKTFIKQQSKEPQAYLSMFN